MKNLLIALVIVVFAGAVFFAMQGNRQPAQEQITGNQEQAMEGTNVSPTVSSASPTIEAMEDSTSAKTFNVDGSKFAFSLKQIKVKQGDTVKITFTNKEGTHDFVLDEFDAKTARLAPGKSETVEFVADKKGSFEYYCSVGAHRQMGMVGTLVVE